MLKGAVLFYLWEGDLHRPARDVDFLGFGDPSIASVTEALRDVCTHAGAKLLASDAR